MRIVRSLPALLATIVALGMAACSAETEPEPLDLSERLGSGKARAGVVAKTSDLLEGPTAGGSVGDYKLYNSKIAVIIESPGPSDGYDIYGGKIVDADIIREPGEPGRSNFGEVFFTWSMRTVLATSAEIVNDGRDGKAAHLRVRGTDDVFPILQAALGDISDPLRFEIVIDYVLEPDADHVKVTTTILNRDEVSHYVSMHFTGYLLGDGLRMFAPGAGFDGVGTRGGQGVTYIGALADHVSYTFFTPGEDVRPALPIEGFQLTDAGSFSAEPDEPHVTEFFFVVGNGDLAGHEATHRELLAQAGEEVPEVGVVAGAVRDGALGVGGATVHVLTGNGVGYVTQTRTDEDGSFRLALPHGSYRLRATGEGRDAGDLVSLTVAGDENSDVMLNVGSLGNLEIIATQNGEPLPVKVQAVRTEPPEALSGMYGLEPRHKGFERVEFLPPEATTLALPPGEWTVHVSRGFEYEVITRTVTIEPNGSHTIEAKMEQVVDTKGWLSGDFHIHAQYSGDSDDLLDHKILSLVAEHVEVPISTEHDYIGDFQPTIERMGLTRYARSIIGSEISTMTFGHINAFPLEQDLSKPNKGAYQWYGLNGEEVTALIRTNPANPVVQMNHPRQNALKGFFTATDFDPVTFTPRKPENWTLNFDAIEIANGGRPRFEDWFAFLDRGYRMLATGNSDSHTSRSDMVGYPRNYVFTEVDEPEALDMDSYMESMRAGRMSVSGGIFVEIASGSALPGDILPLTSLNDGKLPLRVRVQAPSWIPVNGSLEVVVNSEVVATLDPTDADPVVRIDETIEVPVSSTADSWIMARISGNSTLNPVAPGAHSFGFTNPIFVDADGNGDFDGRID